MKRLLLTLLFMGFSIGQAENIDCSTVTLSITGISYFTKEVFPKRSKTISLDMDDQDIDFHECGLKVKSSGGDYFSADAGKRSKLLEILSSNAPHERYYFDILKILYPFAEGTMDTYNLYFAYYPDENVVSYFEPFDEVAPIIGSVLVQVSIGVKINGGAIQPLLYEGEFTPAKSSKPIETLEFYTYNYFPSELHSDVVKLSTFNRIYVDFNKGLIQVSKDFPLP